MVSKPKVYLETSFISYMIVKDTTNVKIASEQAWTRKWRAEIAPACDVFASNFVVEEAKDGVDAFHVATAAVCGVDYLLTWNCKHIANPVRLPQTIDVIRKSGFVCPQILKPSTYFEYMEQEG